MGGNSGGRLWSCLYVVLIDREGGVLVNSSLILSWTFHGKKGEDTHVGIDPY